MTPAEIGPSQDCTSRLCAIHIDKQQRGCPKRCELPDVNINTGAKNINTERASLKQNIKQLNCQKQQTNKQTNKQTNHFVQTVQND